MTSTNRRKTCKIQFASDLHLEFERRPEDRLQLPIAPGTTAPSSQLLGAASSMQCVGIGYVLEDRHAAGLRVRAYRDVLAACPREQDPIPTHVAAKTGTTSTAQASTR